MSSRPKPLPVATLRALRAAAAAVDGTSRGQIGQRVNETLTAWDQMTAAQREAWAEQARKGRSGNGTAGPIAAVLTRLTLIATRVNGSTPPRTLVAVRAAIALLERHLDRQVPKVVRQGVRSALRSRKAGGLPQPLMARRWGPWVDRSKAVHTPALRVLPDDRPVTRADCLPGGTNAERPCPYLGCKHHLALETDGSGGVREMLDWDDGQPSCALDVADQGSHGLRETGDLLGLTKQWTREIELRAISKVKNTAVGREMVDLLGRNGS